MTSSGAARHLQPRPTALAGGGEAEIEYAKDTWEAPRLGIAVRRGREKARFGVIGQEWLREAIKQWSRFRLSSGYSFNTIESGAQSLARFSLFLAEHPEVTGFDGITRDLLDDFLSWMSSARRLVHEHPPPHADLREGAARLGPPTWHSARTRRQRRHL